MPGLPVPLLHRNYSLGAVKKLAGSGWPPPVPAPVSRRVMLELELTLSARGRSVGVSDEELLLLLA